MGLWAQNRERTEHSRRKAEKKSKHKMCLLICESHMKKIFLQFWRYKSNSRTRKKLVAAASRREGVYNRTGEPSVTFCERGGARKRADDLFSVAGKKISRSKANFAPAWRKRWDSNPRARKGYLISSFPSVCYLHGFSCQFQSVLYARKPA